MRIQKTLEDANVKIASFISDIAGKSGRAILTNLIGGATDPQAILAGTSKRLKATPAELGEALRGQVTKNHRFLLKLHSSTPTPLPGELSTSSMSRRAAGRMHTALAGKSF